MKIANTLQQFLDSPNECDKLYLNCKILTDKDLSNLILAIEENTVLRIISFSYMLLNVDLIHIISKKLQADSTLTHLLLENVHLGDIEASIIGQALQTNKTLLELSLNKNHIGDNGVLTISKALQKNSTLTILNLSYNQISDVGATAIGQALHSNVVLSKLYLSYNKFGDNGLISICHGLMNNTDLYSLSLENNNISDGGAIVIGEVLKKNTIRQLYISYNQIGNDGAIAIAEALQYNTTLYRLYLCHNQIGDAGTIAIAEALQHNTILKELFIENNKISSKGVAKLKSLSGINKLEYYIQEVISTEEPPEYIVTNNILMKNFDELPSINENNSPTVIDQTVLSENDVICDSDNLLHNDYPKVTIQNKKSLPYSNEFYEVIIDKIGDVRIENSELIKLNNFFENILDGNIKAFKNILNNELLLKKENNSFTVTNFYNQVFNLFTQILEEHINVFRKHLQTEELIELLDKEIYHVSHPSVTINDLKLFYDQIIKYNMDVEETINIFVLGLHNYDNRQYLNFSASWIIKKYAENKLHLSFILTEVNSCTNYLEQSFIYNNIILANLDNDDLISIAYEYDDYRDNIDWDLIEEKLGKNKLESILQKIKYLKNYDGVYPNEYYIGDNENNYDFNNNCNSTISILGEEADLNVPL